MAGGDIEHVLVSLKVHIKSTPVKTFSNFNSVNNGRQKENDRTVNFYVLLIIGVQVLQPFFVFFLKYIFTLKKMFK